jgi:hypothetical protein
MAAKPSFCRPFSAPRRPSPRFTRGRFGIAALAASTAVLAFGASAALADPGSVYVDHNSNVGAGHDFFGGNTPSGGFNVGLGDSVMPNLTTGNFNLATGDLALFDNTTGFANVASGYLALESNTAGNDNVASGVQALAGNTTGSLNTAVGFDAGQDLTTGSNNVEIANDGHAGESNAIRIGTKGTQQRAFIAGVSGKTIPGPTQRVVVNAQGQLGTATAAKVSAGPKPLSAADGRRMMAEIGRLKAKVRRLGG